MLLGICKDMTSFVIVIVYLSVRYLRLGWGLTGGCMASLCYHVQYGSVPNPT